MDYYAQEALNEINRRKEEAETLAKGRQNIKRLKTKEGKDFKNISQCFTKGAITNNYYNPTEKQIKIHERNDKGHYFEDYLNITPTVYNGTPEAEKLEKEGRLISRGGWLHPCYMLTADEIEQLINKRIKYYKIRIDEYNQVIKEFEEIASVIVDFRQKAERFIQSQPQAVYYILRAILRGRKTKVKERHKTMDNLNNKTITQFYYDTDNGKIIITKLEEKSKNWAEWWGHVEGYCKTIMLFAGEKIDNRKDKDTADYCAFTYYDDIIDMKED